MEYNTDAGRDRAALGHELMQGFAGRLIRQKARGVCRALNLGQADAEDVEQQIRLELLIRAAKYDPDRGTWEAFVTCVAESRARTHYRRLRRLPRPFPFSDVFPEAATGSEVSEAEGRRHVAGAIESSESDLHQDVEFLSEQLDLDNQMLTELLRIWSVTEVARALELPRSTVADRVRALQRPFAELQRDASSESHP
ncbi:MAG: sigma factor [Parvibaculaceae bacterium]